MALPLRPLRLVVRPRPEGVADTLARVLVEGLAQELRAEVAPPQDLIRRLPPKSILRRAVKVAQDSGALSNAGQAALTLLEEHGAARLHEEELYKVYHRADELLKGTQDAEEIARLRACARIVIKRLSGMRLGDRNFTLYGAVQQLEARLIEQALKVEEGSVTRAARRLGMKHQTLSHLLRTRHKKILGKRTPANKLKRSIIKDQI